MRCGAQMEDHPMIKTKTAKLNQANRSNHATTRQRRDVGGKKTQAQPLIKHAARKRTAGPEHPPRNDSKQQLCLDLLRRPEGASIEDLRRVTGWQAHSVRGFLSGVVKRKLGSELAAHKSEHQPRRYRI